MTTPAITIPVKKRASLTAQALGFLLGSIIVGFGFTAGAAFFTLLMF